MENVLQYLYAAVGPLLWALAMFVLIASFAAVYQMLSTSKSLTEQDATVADTEYSSDLVSDGYTERAEILGLLAVKPSTDLTVYGTKYTVQIDVNDDDRTQVVVKDTAGKVYLDTIYDEGVWNLELTPTKYVTDDKFYRTESVDTYTGELSAVVYTAQNGS